MNPKSRITWSALLAILVSSACVLTIPVPGAAPTAAAPAPEFSLPAPLQIEEITPTVMATWTEPILPTLTIAFTSTFFPTITPLPTSTLTPSITPSPLPVEIATLGSGDIPPETLTQFAATPLSSGDPIGAEYSCLVISKKVADMTVYKPKTQFTAWWDMRNVGRKKWAEGLVILNLVEGPRLTTDRYFALPSEPQPGERIRLSIEVTAPAKEGTYLTTWGLKNTRSGRHFCFFTLNIVVKK